MAVSDYDGYKGVEPTDDGGSTPSISNAFPYYVKMVSGSNSTTGTGNIEIDDSNVDGPEDIAIYDANENKLDYYWVTFDTTNGVYEAWFRFSGLNRNNTEQIRIYYGNGVSDESVSVETVMDSVFGLGAAYNFEESSGSLLDLTSNNNDGTVNGATQGSTGQFGNGYSFDGTDDYISIPDSATTDLGSSFTVLMWINDDGTSVNDNPRFFFTPGSSDSNPTDVKQLLWQNDTYIFEVGDGSSKSTASWSNSRITGSWQAWGLRFDSQNQIGLYNQGSSVASSSTTLSSASANDAIHLMEGENNRYAGGNMDGVFIFHNDAIDTAYIKAHADMGPANGQTLFSQNAFQLNTTSLTLNDTARFQEELKINGDLSGKVTLGGTGVDGADVFVISLKDRALLGETTTDANGNYSFPELAPNERYLVATHYYDTGTSTRYADAKTETPS